VTSRFGTSEADEAGSLLKGLEALSKAEAEASQDVRAHPLPSITHPSKESSLVDGLLPEPAANPEPVEPMDPAAKGKGANMSSTPEGDEPAPGDTAALTWEQLEENITMLATKPQVLDGMWGMGNFGSDPATLEQLHELIDQHVDKRIGGLPQLKRAFHALFDAEEKSPSVERPEYYKILAGAFYFGRLFELFPDAPDTPEKTLDLVGFKAAIGKLALAEPITDFGAIFDAFESNDGGLVHFDDFAVWYIAKRNTAVFN